MACIRVETTGHQSPDRTLSPDLKKKTAAALQTRWQLLVLEMKTQIIGEISWVQGLDDKKGIYT